MSCYQEDPYEFLKDEEELNVALQTVLDADGEYESSSEEPMPTVYDEAVGSVADAMDQLVVVLNNATARINKQRERELQIMLRPSWKIWKFLLTKEETTDSGTKEAVTDPDRKKKKQLRDSIHDGKLDQVKTLLSEGMDVNCIIDSKWTPLHFASSKNHPKIVQLLLDKGANIDSIHDGADSPLHQAISANSLDAFTVLMQKRANPNLKAKQGWTPLHAACSYGNHTMVQTLISNGAQIQVLWERFGYSPLHLAALRGDGPGVRVLLKAGADPKFPDRDGFVAWELTSNPEVVEMMAEIQERLWWYARGLWWTQDYPMEEVEEFLSTTKVDINHKYTNKRVSEKTLLSFAVELLDLDWVVILLKHGALISDSDLEYLRSKDLLTRDEKLVKSIVELEFKNQGQIQQLQEKVKWLQGTKR